MTKDAVTDLTRGVYRRIYSGFITGQRINKLSLNAEAWFWRVMATADDFGNAPADPDLCRAATAGRRSVTSKQIAGWLKEMKTVGLITLYRAKGEWFLHVTGFEESQPAGKNGKRIKRYPHEGESGLIQVNPDESSATRASDNEDENDNEDEREVRAAKPRSRGTRSCDEDYLNELQADEAYKRLNVRLIHAKMVRWCSEKSKVPTRARLVNWLNREDQPMEGNNGSYFAAPRTASERNVANIAASLDIVRKRTGEHHPS